MPPATTPATPRSCFGPDIAAAAATAATTSIVCRGAVHTNAPHSAHSERLDGIAASLITSGNLVTFSLVRS